MLIVLTFGVLDDLIGLRARQKFLGQTIAALVVVLYGGVKITYIGNLFGTGGLYVGWLGIPLTLVFLVGAANAINLADGLDGLAAGLCLLSFMCVAYLGHVWSDFTVTLLSTAMIGAIFGFIRFNTHPAIVFLGDAGSQLLGFSAGVLALVLTQKDMSPLSPILPLFILGFPIIDTLSVMVERALAHRPLFMADKNHFHHKLLRLGFHHRESVIIIYAIQAGLVTTAFLGRYADDGVLFWGYGIFALFIVSSIHYMEHRGIRIRSGALARTGNFAISNHILDLSPVGTLCFRAIQFVAPALLIALAICQGLVSQDVAVVATAILACSAAVFWVKAEWFDLALRFGLYVLSTFLIYSNHIHPASFGGFDPSQVFNRLFIALAVILVGYVVFISRERFQTTPLDFLILFVALVVPNLPDRQIQAYQLGPIAAKVIVLFYCFEVILTRVRTRINGLSLATFVSLGMTGLRGLW
jgi:UDP-GlcNAc:undecaprenyl-phosphate GlcNAc-1-phosphate transferase